MSTVSQIAARAEGHEESGDAEHGPAQDCRQAILSFQVHRILVRTEEKKKKNGRKFNKKGTKMHV